MNDNPYYRLFTFFTQEHGLALTNEEIQEVIHRVERCKDELETSTVDRAAPEEE